ncbi:MAG: membrane protein insertion efficiency factor YidD [Propionibacterium sp.]|nr:MAG: membrane protein insertion efficiency factor YidD [Propionibacterium sp.]
MIGKILAIPMIWFVRAWRKLISPLYGDVCKYYPSCSTYGLVALQHHGAFKGGALTISRVLRCNPWSKGGFDYVPGTAEHEQYLAGNEPPALEVN